MQSIGKTLREWLSAIAIALVVSLAFRTYVAEAVVVRSGSMENTLQIRDILVMEKLVRPADLNYGDIVVFYPPLPNQHERYVKRLIGKGGDVIEIHDGALYRNGVKVDEPYLKERMDYRYGPVRVPKGTFFFLGDNRNDSYDSHLWPDPFVPASEIVGKAIFRCYPLTRMASM